MGFLDSGLLNMDVEGFALFHAAHIPSEHEPAGSLQVGLPKEWMV